MTLKKYILALFLMSAVSNIVAMRPSVTINVSGYPTSSYMPYYPTTYVSTYYPTYYYPTYSSYSYWPTWGFYDYPWWIDYSDSPIASFIKACEVVGVLCTALAIIGVLASH